MPFLLNIRHNVASAADHFGRGDVRRFDQTTVLVGSGEHCECRMEDAAFSEEHVRISAGDDGQTWIEPVGTAETLLNDTPLQNSTALASGDEIRVEHWTLRFQRLYPDVGVATKTNLLALGAKILIVCILLTEIGLVSWLPFRLRTAALWQSEIAKQRIALLLDDLRARIDSSIQPTGDFDRSVLDAVGIELDAHARYLREHDEQIGPEQRRRLYDDLLSFDKILRRMEGGTLRSPPEPLDVDTAVKAILQRHNSGTRDE